MLSHANGHTVRNDKTKFECVVILCERPNVIPQKLTENGK